MLDLDELRRIVDPLEWARKAQAAIDCGDISTTQLLTESHLPRSVVLDRVMMVKVIDSSKEGIIETGRKLQQLAALSPDWYMVDLARNLDISVSFAEEALNVVCEIDKAEAHGKVIGKAEKVQEENDKMFLRCAHCKNRISVGSLHGAGTCDGIPEERGLARCLEPGCRKWIKAPETRPLPLQAADYFCKEHKTRTQSIASAVYTTVSEEVFSGEYIDRCIYQTSGKTKNIKIRRSLSNMPLVDRDGDAIWVTRDLEVIKVQVMDDDHLTNCLNFLEAAAKRRCAVTGVDESKWKERVGPRYDSLVKEAKRRDEALRCPCKDGLISVVTKTDTRLGGMIAEVIVEEIFCKDCTLGRGRQAAKEVAAKVAASGGLMSLKVAMVMVVSLIVGGQLPAGSYVVAWFIDYLRAHGCIK